MGVRIPTGTRQSDLSQPIPGSDQTQAATAGATEQLGQLDRAPAAVTSQDLPADAPAQGEMSPEEQAALAQADALSADEQGLLAQADTMGQAALQQDVPSAGPSGALLPNGLIRDPAGKLKKYDPSGNIVDFTPEERADAKNMAAILRRGGPIAGAILGSGAGGAAGMTIGPVAAVRGAQVGLGIGTPIGARLAEGPASVFDEIAQQTTAPRTVVTDVVEGASAFLSGLAGTKIATGTVLSPNANLAANAMQAEEKARIAQKEIQDRVVARKEDFAALGQDALPTQLHQENLALVDKAQRIAAGEFGPRPQQELMNAEISQRKALTDMWGTLVDSFKPLETSPKKALESVRDVYEGRIAGQKAQVYKIAGGREFDAKPLVEQVEGVLNERKLLRNGAALDGKSYSSGEQKIVNFLEDVRERAGGAGYTIPEMDGELKSIGKLANFDGGRLRTPEERAWGEVYNRVRMFRDNATVIATEKVAPELAQALRANRDFYFKNVDQIEAFADKVKTDPINAAKALIPTNNPEAVRQLKHILPEEVFDGLANQMLDNMRGNLGSSEGKIGASGVAKDLAKYSKETLVELYGQSRARDLVKLVNLARRMESAPKLKFGEPAESSIVKLFLKTAVKADFSKTPALIARMFENNRPLQEYITTEMMAQDPSGFMKAQARTRASLRTQSRWAEPVKSVGGTIAGGVAGAGLMELLQYAGNKVFNPEPAVPPSEPPK